MQQECGAANFVQGGKKRLGKGGGITPGVWPMSRVSWHRGGHRVLLSEGTVCAKDQGLETIWPPWGRGKELKTAETWSLCVSEWWELRWEIGWCHLCLLGVWYFSRNEAMYLLVLYCFCNKLIQTQWLKTVQIYYLTITKVRSLKWVLEGWN